jgi:hypothetical protein
MFWNPDDIYDVACPNCGKGVEFWKDDARRTCECGHRFSNPKRDFGCLAYCKYAENCMPEMFVGESLQAIYKDRLIAALAQALQLDAARRRRISEAAELGQEALAAKGCEPLVATAAALMSHLVGEDPSGSGAITLDEARARGILSKVGTEPQVIDLICAMVWHSTEEARASRPMPHGF